MNYAAAMSAQQEITYHWCSCGGKSGSSDCSPVDPPEHPKGPRISFTADRSGNVQICQCSTTWAPPWAGRAGSRKDVRETTRILEETNRATA